MSSRPLTGQVPLPRTFTCRICGREQPPTAFSKNQLQKWYNEKRKDRYNEVTPQTIGLACKNHSVGEREIRCHGPCDRLKVAEHFSKNQRNDPDPWCIDCTEWRLSFDGNEAPVPVPNTPLEYGRSHGVENNSEPIQKPFLPAFSDEEYEDESEDEVGGVYGNPTPITGLCDRLEGYGRAPAGPDASTDAVSTTDGVAISLWGGNANIGGSKSNASAPMGDWANMQTQATKSGRMLGDSLVGSHTGRDGASSQGFSPIVNDITTPAGVAPHLNRLAQAGRYSYSDEGPRTFLGRSTASHPHQGQENGRGIEKGVLTTVNEAIRHKKPENWAPHVKNQEPSKKNNTKWYKGDNRKVFLGPRKYPANTIQDRTEATHDSDSPDEM